MESGERVRVCPRGEVTPQLYLKFSGCCFLSWQVGWQGGEAADLLGNGPELHVPLV